MGDNASAAPTPKRIRGALQISRPCTGYNPRENPSVTNVFATAAFRFGHSLIKPVVKRLDENLQPHSLYGDLPLYKAFFNPYQLFKRGGIDPIIRGLVYTGSKDKSIELNGPMNPQLIERLFESSDRVALDLGKPIKLNAGDKFDIQER
jgi:hypothetical protein